MASEIERSADLTGYVKVASVPDWYSVRLTPFAGEVRPRARRAAAPPSAAPASDSVIAPAPAPDPLADAAHAPVTPERQCKRATSQGKTRAKSAGRWEQDAESPLTTGRIQVVVAGDQARCCQCTDAQDARELKRAGRPSFALIPTLGMLVPDLGIRRSHAFDTAVRLTCMSCSRASDLCEQPVDNVAYLPLA
jgi:hypothetical protein